MADQSGGLARPYSASSYLAFVKGIPKWFLGQVFVLKAWGTSFVSLCSSVCQVPKNQPDLPKTRVYPGSPLHLGPGCADRTNPESGTNRTPTAHTSLLFTPFFGVLGPWARVCPGPGYTEPGYTRDQSLPEARAQPALRIKISFYSYTCCGYWVVSASH